MSRATAGHRAVQAEPAVVVMELFAWGAPASERPGLPVNAEASYRECSAQRARTFVPAVAYGPLQSHRATQPV